MVQALKKGWSRRCLALILCVLLSLLTACKGGGAALTEQSAEQYRGAGEKETAAQKEFDDFCDSLFKEEMSAASTLDLHYTLLHPEAYGIERPAAGFGSYSLETLISDTQEAKRLREQLSGFDFLLLSDEQKKLFDTLAATLDATLLREGLELYEQPLAPTIGVQAQLPILLAEYAFASKEDIENYLNLLSQIDTYYSGLLAFEEKKAEAGLAPSDASIDEIIASCESYRIDPESNFLTETFEARLERLGQSTSLSEEEKELFRLRHQTAIKDHFIPAYESLIQGMEALKGRGLREGGLAELADGRRYYEYLVKSGPGVSCSVKELKTMLEQRIQADLNTVQTLYTENPSLTTQEISFSLTNPAQILEDLRQKIKADFPALPDCGYEIRYVPEYLEDSLSPAFYLTAPMDDVDQNVIYINRAYSDSSENLYTTLAHEGFPGHLYQTVYSRMNASSPLAAILSCSGANEGWATYVENYAWTMDNGLTENAGACQAALRSLSLCVHGLLDIGINYEGWNREEAAKFIQTYFQADDETVAKLWQVMIDNPANYLEYCGGYAEIMEMRKEAEDALGRAFSPMEFHRFFLDLGPVPFSVARKYFAEWLETQ